MNREDTVFVSIELSDDSSFWVPVRKWQVPFRIWDLFQEAAKPGAKVEVTTSSMLRAKLSEAHDEGSFE